MNKEQVNEFLFSNAEDAGLAMKEKKQVQYLEKHMDTSNPQNVLLLYEKANRERIFRTPVGLSYLQGLREQLLKAGMKEEEIPPICVYAEYNRSQQSRPEPVKTRIIQTKRETMKRRLQFSIILNVLLVAAVIAMFVIALGSDNPNILNYERTLQDRYASWEQELTDREAELREKERDTQSP